MDTVEIKWDIFERVFLVSETLKMPSDIVSIAVSTGLGISVVAGILSGLCYVLAHKVQRSSNRKITREWYCNVCNTNLRSINGILEGDKAVVCVKCRRQVCKAQCSTFNHHSGWVCKTCHNLPESWFKGILNTIQLNPLELLSDIMNPDSQHETADTKSKQTPEKEQVRDFIERLVSVMLGENVDDANVSKLYNDQSYLPLTGQSPCTAHAAFKQLIERLLQETAHLPKLRNLQAIPDTATNETDRTYEDLLATAIINKVISSNQHARPTSSAASVSSRISSSSKNRNDKEYFFGEETLETKWRTTDLETSSVSSLEEWIHSDSSFGSKKYVDKFTLTIKQDIEEVSQSDSENQDDSEYFRTQSSLLSEDEPNWFLQKRQFQGTHSPVPVPMLVPNPTTEAKVLIGDTEVDETSDLSDIASDFEETDGIPATHSLLIESKSIIGGKNPLKNEDFESESSADSGVKEDDVTDKSVCDVATTYLGKADITVDDDNVEDASIHSVYSNTEQEAEYTERYASLPRTVLKTPTPPRRVHRTKSLEKRSLQDNIDKQDVTSKEQVEIEVFPGNYSRREKEKWKHAIQMENNPYSVENIEKRIRRSSSSVSSLFGPDYYARQASSPTGTRLKSPEDKEVMGPAIPKEEETQEVAITLSDESYVNSNQGDEVFEITNTESVFIEPLVNVGSARVTMPKTSLSDTSDTDLSIINCYNIEKSQVYKSKGTTLDVNSNSINEPDNHETKLKLIPQKEILVSRDRPRYMKLHSFKPRTVTPTINISELKRNKSETDIQSCFDAPPKIIHKKKDNTIISKIYSNPHVRNFALSSRQQLPIEDVTNQNRYNGRKTLYNSDEAISSSRFSNSLDNLLDLDNKDVTYMPATTRNYQVKSVSSEDDLLSDVGSYHKSPNHIYSSNEDFKMNETSHHKKDNTIISKIYQDQKVRDFALSTRSYSIGHDFSRENKSTEIKLVGQNNPLLVNTSQEIILFDKKNQQNEQKLLSPVSPDIEELTKKKIVHCILDQISKSNPKFNAVTDKSVQGGSNEEINISVKALRKKFENNDAKNPVVSSLTARSLSKQIRNHLKN